MNSSLKEEENFLTEKKTQFKKIIFIISSGALSSFLIGLFFLYPLLSNISIRSDLHLPHQKALLNRSGILTKIDKMFKSQQSEIKSVTLIGMGGAGKTTLSHLYARSQNNPLVWEINAETKESLLNAFKDLAYALSKTPEQKSDLNLIQKNTNIVEQEKQLLFFVKNRLKEESPWILIYDNVEILSDIKDFIPADEKAWGSGNILMTTRDINSQNTSYINPENVVFIDELEQAEALTLFTQILYDKKPSQLNVSQRAESAQILQKIPHFPLDISVAAYYIKNTQITVDQYLEKIQLFTKEFDQDQQHILKNINAYAKTRYGIIQTSLEKVMEVNPQFKDLLLFVCFLDSQNIPKDLLTSYKDAAVVNQFIYQLKKCSLIINESSSDALVTFSMHRNVQQAGEQYLIKVFNSEKGKSFLLPIIKSLAKYAQKAREDDDFTRLKLLVMHYEKLLTYKNELNEMSLGSIQAELGAIYAYIGNIEKAQPLLETGLALLNQYDSTNYLSIAQTLAYLGCVNREQGNYHKAKGRFEQALVLYKASLPQNHQTLAWVLTFLGKVYGGLGNYKKSAELIENSIGIYKENSLRNHPQTVWAMTYLGNIYRRLGHYQKAKDILEEGRLICQKYLPDHPLSEAAALITLGEVYGELEDYEKARDLAEQGLSLYRKYSSATYLKLAKASTFLGSMYCCLGDFNKAKTLIEEGLSIYKKHFPQNTTKISQTLVELGKVYKGLGDYKKAQEILEQVLISLKESYDMYHIEIGKVLLVLGQISLLEEQLEKAESILNQALVIFENHNIFKTYECFESLGDLLVKKSLREKNKEAVGQYKDFQEKAKYYFMKSLEIFKLHELTDQSSLLRIREKLSRL